MAFFSWRTIRTSRSPHAAVKGSVDASASPSGDGTTAAEAAVALSAASEGGGNGSGSGSGGIHNRDGALEGFDKAAGDMRRPEALALSGERWGPACVVV